MNIMINIEQLYSVFQQHPVVSTDSRTCPPDAVFFALKGDTFDGNDYIEQVLAAGAAYAVGDRTDLPNDKRIIRVDNALQTLQDLANYHRKQMPATVIAVTGTNGKTTTKELIAAALLSQYSTLYTQGNLNNHIGVPLTLLQLQPEHRFAVIEMGANHPGEIRALCRIAEPGYGLITNVGKAHLEGFGSFEGVIRTKVELYDFLRSRGGTVFASSDNPVLRDLYGSLPSVIRYGTTSEALIRGKIVASAPVLTMEWDGGSITTHLAGSYNFENVLAAICVASYFGVERETINAAIENYIPVNNRSQHVDTGRNHLIIDAYNANPSSMQAALENFNALKVRPKMLILGEMKELGDYSREEHQQLTDYILPDIHTVFLIGENYAACTSLPSEWKLFPMTDALVEYLQANPLRGYHILIKGSRSNRLEKIIPYL
ncbi:MAG: UDP-N-acetylmuramoyl-tripeptide--D-alanyl-D-alanine ligase [Dysgonamonadaceae bacterium]|jgi:UDP-N-acetylmuramoyl-tripeptide--D-alanyl-D-alanine ligase|nr:UDP-N-acetylmuramoyl-tripeptide--D-alanyl-D-alanine ligase [Dysgonamonadaceae bacterium]